MFTETHLVVSSLHVKICISGTKKHIAAQATLLSVLTIKIVDYMVGSIYHLYHVICLAHGLIGSSIEYIVKR